MSNVKKSRFFLLAAVMITIIALLIAKAPVWFCQHEQTGVVTQQATTCHTKGEYQRICVKCKTVLSEWTEEMKEHNYSEYEIVKEPLKGKNGEQKRECLRCGNVEISEFECKHSVALRKLKSVSTCTSVGQEDLICSRCFLPIARILSPKRPHTLIQKTIVAPSCTAGGRDAVICSSCDEQVDIVRTQSLGHQWKDWEYPQRATPLSSGKKSRTCARCQQVQTRQYTITMKSNGVYIASAGLNAEITPGPFTQYAVDTCDIVYCPSVRKLNNPFILGHDYNSLGVLPKTHVGDIVYVSLNGEITQWQVVVSSKAYQTPDWRDIRTKDGISVYDSVGSSTLHMYTCYGNDRWIVLAKKI